MSIKMSNTPKSTFQIVILSIMGSGFWFSGTRLLGFWSDSRYAFIYLYCCYYICIYGFGIFRAVLRSMIIMGSVIHGIRYIHDSIIRDKNCKFDICNVHRHFLAF